MWKYDKLPHMNYSKGIYSHKEWLKEQYTKKRKSLREIAEMCDVDFKTIHYWVRLHELPRQPVGDRPGNRCNKWKGGKTKSYGYVLRTINGRYFPEHRIVAATVLKRGLRKGEVIHHIDIHPLNNKPSNLYVFPSQKEHKAYHQALKYGYAKPLKSNLK
jgi:hypothetical protein